MTWQPSRRNFIKATAAATGAGILTACGSTSQPASPSKQAKIVQPKHTYPARSGDNVLRVVAPSGFAENPAFCCGFYC